MANAHGATPAQAAPSSIAGGESTGSAPAAPGHAPDGKKLHRGDSARETVESIVVAFVLAFLFRTFEAEAFVIPTGSMAPTLYGQHRDVTCSQCGMRFSVGAAMPKAQDSEVFYERERGWYFSPANRTHSAICSNCRFPESVIDHEIFKGDRILVSKFPYEIDTPNRWDVVVFKYPEGADMNYIKRLVGLPGEELKLEWGDVFVRRTDTEPFRIPRKTPEKQKVLQLLVYDDTHPPKALLKAGWPERWHAEPGARWSHDPLARAFSFEGNDPAGDAVHWIRYRHILPTADDWTRAVHEPPEAVPAPPPRPQLITDFYAYNAKITGQVRGDPARLPDVQFDDGEIPLGNYWVGDLTVSGKLDVLAPEGELVLELVEGERRYRARLSLATGRGTLWYLDDRLAPPEAEEPMSLGDEFTSGVSGAGTYRFRFCNVDDRVCLWINDRLVKAVEFEPNSRYLPHSERGAVVPGERDLAPVGIGARGARVRVSQLLLERDTYYRAARAIGAGHEEEYQTAGNAAELRELLTNPDQWAERFTSTRRRPFTFKLADSAEDAEDEFMVLGDNSPRSKDSRLWETGPAVPRRMLIGKAFFIYWPHGVPFLNGGKGYPIRVWNELDREGRPQKSNVHIFSAPFYPQVGRMQRIR